MQGWNSFDVGNCNRMPTFSFTSGDLYRRMEMKDRKPILLRGDEELQFLQEFCRQNDYVLDRLTIITETARYDFEKVLMPVEMVQ